MFIPDGSIPKKWVPAVVLLMLNGLAAGQASFLKKMTGEKDVLAKLDGPEEEKVCAELRLLMESWLFSGKDRSNQNADTLTKRNLTTLHPAFKKTLWTILNEWKDRHPPRLSFSGRGEVSILYDEPQYQSGASLYGVPKNTTTPTDIAIFWFVRLLDSPGAHSLARCANPECNIYFGYLRTPKGTLKNGTFCNGCKAARSAVQTTEKRIQNKASLVTLAAEFWGNWKPSTRHGKDKPAWVAKKMNAILGSSRHITRKWVVQNTVRIERHLGLST